MEGKNFYSVNVSVTEFTLILQTLCVCLPNKWKVRHVDANADLLNGDIDQKVSVRHTQNVPGFIEKRATYQLLNSLYGLCQTSLQRFSKMK